MKEFSVDNKENSLVCPGFRWFRQQGYYCILVTLLQLNFGLSNAFYFYSDFEFAGAVMLPVIISGLFIIAQSYVSTL